MKKKLIGIFIVTLLISSAMTTILFSNDGQVAASGDEPQTSEIGLDNDFVWNLTESFANVIRKVNWSEGGENGIPKGRSWATAGENYTIDTILNATMNGTDNPCGLTGFKKLPIGYLPDQYEPGPGQRQKQYSSKIVINDSGFTIHNGTQITSLQHDEFFPIGVGCVPLRNITNITGYLNQNFSFKDAEVKIAIFDRNALNISSYNTSCDILNVHDLLAGQVIYLNTTDSLPESHDGVFILNEEPASESKIENLSDAMGCILIENSTKNYTYQKSDQYTIAITKLNGTNSNFSFVVSSLQKGYTYFVDNLQDNQTLVFSNCTNVLSPSSSDDGSLKN